MDMNFYDVSLRTGQNTLPVDLYEAKTEKKEAEVEKNARKEEPWHCKIRREEWEWQGCIMRDRYDRSEYFRVFYQSGISDDELADRIFNTIRNAYKEGLSKELLNEENGKKFLNSMYHDLTVEIIQLSVFENQSEGEKVNRKYAGLGEDHQFVYYNAQFYYRCEKAKEILRNCLDVVAEEYGVDNSDKGIFLLENMKCTDFNTLWSGCQKNCKMVNVDVEPPEDFTFFYRESYINRTKLPNAYDYVNDRLLIVDGIFSGRRERIKLTETTEEYLKPTNMLDYIKAVLKKEDAEYRLRYLKNFLMTKF